MTLTLIFIATSSSTDVKCKFKKLWDHHCCILDGVKITSDMEDWNIDTSANTKPNDQVKRLDIKNSNLEAINHNIFVVFPNLKRISMITDNSNFNKLRPYDLNGAGKLEKLNLDQNAMTMLVENNFQEAPSLSLLSLGQNKISKIEDGAFRGCAKLRYLYLNDNLLNALTVPMLEGTENLIYFYIFNNNIKAIEPKSLSNMKSLQWLKMENNDCIKADYYPYEANTDQQGIYDSCKPGPGVIPPRVTPSSTTERDIEKLTKPTTKPEKLSVTTTPKTSQRIPETYEETTENLPDSTQKVTATEKRTTFKNPQTDAIEFIETFDNTDSFQTTSTPPAPTPIINKADDEYDQQTMELQKAQEKITDLEKKLKACENKSKNDRKAVKSLCSKFEL